MEKKITLEKGYLDENLNIEIKRLKDTYVKEYELINEFNQMAYNIEKYFTKDNANEKDLYIFTSFSQIHNSFQACVILLERGLFENCQIILRNIYDNIFKVKMLIIDEEYIKDLYQSYLKETKKTLQVIKDNHFFDIFPSDKLDIAMLDFQNRILKDDNNKPINCLSTKEVANKIGMNRQYVYYRILSSYTHSDIKTIDDRIEQKENGFIISGTLNHGNFKEETSKLVESLSLLYDDIINYLNNDELNNLYNSFNKKIEEILS